MQMLIMLLLLLLSFLAVVVRVEWGNTGRVFDVFVNIHLSFEEAKLFMTDRAIHISDCRLNRKHTCKQKNFKKQC